jgi:hypothetical protein
LNVPSNRLVNKYPPAPVTTAFLPASLPGMLSVRNGLDRYLNF